MRQALLLTHYDVFYLEMQASKDLSPELGHSNYLSFDLALSPSPSRSLSSSYITLYSLFALVKAAFSCVAQAKRELCLVNLYMPGIPPLWPSGGLLDAALAASCGYFLMQLHCEIALFPFHTYL